MWTYPVTVQFLLWKGFLAGLAFSVTTIPAAVWCLQLAVWRGWGPAAVAATALAAGQALWAGLAAVAVWALAWHLGMLGRWPEQAARAFCSLVFVYMAWKSLRAQPLRGLPQPAGPAPASARLAVVTLAVVLSMPMRFFGYLGLFLAMNLGRLRLREWHTVPLAAGAGTAALGWFALVALGGVVWHARLAPEFWGRLITRQTRLAAAVYAMMAIIVALPVLLRPAW